MSRPEAPPGWVSDDDTPPRCWAIGPWGRCDLDGIHRGSHEVTFSWTDEECILPGVPVPVIHPPAYTDTPIHTATLVDQAVETNPDRCFSCGCTEVAHLEVGEDGEAGCARHQCRNFVA